MYCQSCKISVDLMKNGKRVLKNGEIKCSYICRSCNTKRGKEYRKTESGKRATRESVRKYEFKNKKRVKAWVIAKSHKPVSQPCIICGEMPTHRHHPDINYPKYVIFLCPYHHVQADKNKNVIIKRKLLYSVEIIKE